MTTAMAVAQPVGIALSGVGDLDLVMNVLAKANAASNPAEAVMKLLVGNAAGLSVGESLSQVSLIKGKPSIGAAAQLAQARRAGIRTRWVEDGTSGTATLRMWMPDDPEPVDTTYTQEMAKRAGLGGDNWKKHPEAMLRARCITAAIRMHCPEVLGGAVYDPDELRQSGRPEPVDAGQAIPLAKPEPKSDDTRARVLARLEAKGLDPEAVAGEAGIPVADWSREHVGALAEAVKTLEAERPEPEPEPEQGTLDGETW